MDVSIDGNFADQSVAAVRDVEIACGIDRHRLRLVEQGLDRRQAIAKAARAAFSRNCFDDSGRANPAHAIVAEVRHVKNRRGDRGVDSDGLRIIELPALNQVGRDRRQQSLLLQNGLSNNSRRGRIENGLRFKQLHSREQKRSRKYGSDGDFSLVHLSRRRHSFVA